MRHLVLTMTFLLAGGCSEPTAPCTVGRSEQGMPAFDLVGSLHNAGAQVEELGERPDLTAFQTPTEVLRVNGEEVLMWRYCVSIQLTEDLGLLGIGALARDPAPIVLPPESHLFTFARVIAQYDGSSQDILVLLTDIMGPEVRP